MNQEHNGLSGQLAAALTFIGQEDYSEAVFAAERELAAAPGSSDAAHVLGLVAIRMEELLRAEELFSLAHKQAPNVREHVEALSIINARLGRLHDALFYGKLASVLTEDADRSALLPDWLGSFQDAFDAIDNTNFIEQGMQQFMRGDVAAAVESLRKGLQAEPGNATGWRGLRDSLMMDRRPYEALLAAQSLASAEQPAGEDLAAVGEILIAIGRFVEGEGCFVDAIEQDPMDLSLRSRFIRTIARCDLDSPDEILRQEALWGGSLPKIPGVRSADKPGSHLTIGVLSGSIRGGSLADLVWPLFDSAAYADVTINVYSNNTRDDALTRRLRGRVDGWTDIGPTDDLTAGTIIRNDGVDILIDLDGHQPGGRPGLAARRPAPTVLRWAGVPVDAVSVARPPYDGVIGDAVLYPDGGDRCVLVDGGPFALPPDAVVAPPQAFPKGVPLRVGLSVARWQLSNAVFDFIQGICNESTVVEFVLDYAALGGMSALDDIDPILEERGIYNRVGPSQPSDTAADGLAGFLNACDVVLDIGPTPAPALLWECLSRSKPMFSIPGRQPQSRFTASVMTGIGLAETVAESFDDMAGKLSGLGADADAVNALLVKVHQLVTKECVGSVTSERSKRFMESLAVFQKSRQKIEA